MNFAKITIDICYEKPKSKIYLNATHSTSKVWSLIVPNQELWGDNVTFFFFSIGTFTL